MIASDGKSLKDYELKKKEIKAVPDENFVGKEVAGYKVVRNPGGEEKPAPPAVAAPPAAAAPDQQRVGRNRIFGNRRNN